MQAVINLAGVKRPKANFYDSSAN